MKEIISVRKIRKYPRAEVEVAARKIRKIRDGQMHESYICTNLEQELWEHKDNIDEYVKQEFGYELQSTELKIPSFLGKEKNNRNLLSIQSEAQADSNAAALIGELNDIIKSIEKYGAPTRSHILIDLRFDNKPVKHRIYINEKR